MSEMVNKYFIDSVSELKMKLETNTQPAAEKCETKSINLEETSETEVMDIIMALSKSAPGIDEIRTDHVKAIAQELAKCLVHLVNRIIETAVYPEIFKLAIITPINKTGDKTNVKDYRPISVLTTFNKIVEKILHNRLVSFTDDYLKRIYKCQFGYRKKSSTETAALEMISDIQKEVDNKSKVSLVFMDLQKAFDIVDVNELLLTLKNCGIRGNALKLFRSYLSNRRQVVRVNGVLSSEIVFTQGVVQGSVLGSWLFLLFFNSIAELQLNGKIFLFADDCVLLNVHEMKENIEVKVCKDMKKIIEYLSSKKLMMNEKKTNFMIIHSAAMKVEDSREIKIEANEGVDGSCESFIIKRVETAKYLGLIIDECLKWEQHIQHIEMKLCNAAGILWKLKNTLPLDIKKKIYKSLFETHLNYMIMIWGSASYAAIKSLQTIQNRALRNVYNLDRHTNRCEMYSKLVESNLPIRALFHKVTAGFVFKTIKRQILTNIQFNRVASRTGRRAEYLKPSAAKTLYGYKRIHSIGPRIFNDLPRDIQNCRHIHEFTRMLKIHLQKDDLIGKCFNGEFLEQYTRKG
jgi:hypothetical protein